MPQNIAVEYIRR